MTPHFDQSKKCACFFLKLAFIGRLVSIQKGFETRPEYLALLLSFGVCIKETAFGCHHFLTVEKSRFLTVYVVVTWYHKHSLVNVTTN